jgi:hypothetical protein
MPLTSTESCSTQPTPHPIPRPAAPPLKPAHVHRQTHFAITDDSHRLALLSTPTFSEESSRVVAWPASRGVLATGRPAGRSPATAATVSPTPANSGDASPRRPAASAPQDARGAGQSSQRWDKPARPGKATASTRAIARASKTPRSGTPRGCNADSARRASCFEPWLPSGRPPDHPAGAANRPPTTVGLEARVGDQRVVIVHAIPGPRRPAPDLGGDRVGAAPAPDVMSGQRKCH